MNNAVQLANILNNPNVCVGAKSSQAKGSANVVGLTTGENGETVMPSDGKKFSEALQERIDEKTDGGDVVVKEESQGDDKSDGQGNDYFLMSSLVMVANESPVKNQVVEVAVVADGEILTDGQVDELTVGDEAVEFVPQATPENISVAEQVNVSTAGENEFSVLAVGENVNANVNANVKVADGVAVITPGLNEDNQPQMPTVVINQQGQVVSAENTESAGQVVGESAEILNDVSTAVVRSEVVSSVGEVVVAVSDDGQGAVDDAETDGADVLLQKAVSGQNSQTEESASQQGQNQLGNKEQGKNGLGEFGFESEFDGDDFQITESLTQGSIANADAGEGDVVPQTAGNGTQLGSIENVADIGAVSALGLEDVSISGSSNVQNARAVDITNPVQMASIEIARQVQESIQSSFDSGNKEMTVQLSPGHLGRMTINMTENADGVTVMLQVEKAQTRDEIQRALPNVLHTLENSGVVVRKVEVVLTNQNQQNNSQSGQSEFSMGSENSESNQQSEQSSQNASSVAIDDVDYNSKISNTQSNPYESYFNDDSIDMMA